MLVQYLVISKIMIIAAKICYVLLTHVNYNTDKQRTEY